MLVAAPVRAGRGHPAVIRRTRAAPAGADGSAGETGTLRIGSTATGDRYQLSFWPLQGPKTELLIDYRVVA